MAKGREIKLPLPAADDLFSTQEERDEAKREYVADIPLIEISDFPNHPYKVKQDESMLELAASIREKGVVNPALVRPKPEGGYEMVAGHRRKFASELAGKAVMPCIVRNLTDDEATIIMVDSNLQREKVLPSEKAFAYKMKLDAMKRQGKRSDLTSVPLAQKLQGKTSRQLLGEQVGESQDQIRRYIRLTELITPILDMVDEGKIAMRPAAPLSVPDGFPARFPVQWCRHKALHPLALHRSGRWKHRFRKQSDLWRQIPDLLVAGKHIGCSADAMEPVFIKPEEAGIPIRCLKLQDPAVCRAAESFGYNGRFP